MPLLHCNCLFPPSLGQPIITCNHAAMTCNKKCYPYLSQIPYPPRKLLILPHMQPCSRRPFLLKWFLTCLRSFQLEDLGFFRCSAPDFNGDDDFTVLDPLLAIVTEGPFEEPLPLNVAMQQQPFSSKKRASPSSSETVSSEGGKRSKLILLNQRDQPPRILFISSLFFIYPLVMGLCLPLPQHEVHLLELLGPW